MPGGSSKVAWIHGMVAIGVAVTFEVLRRRHRAAGARQASSIASLPVPQPPPVPGAIPATPPAQGAKAEVPKPEEKLFGLRTLLEALQVSELVTTESIEGPFQLNPGEQAPLVCFQFKMSHFVCKVYLAAGAEEGTRHLKLQTIFEDNRNGLIEEHRYFMANEWNSSKPYTRLQCGSRDRGQTNVFTLEYDLLCPVQLPHHPGVQMLVSTLRMWYTSMMACVMHIVAPRDLPFATHTMIVENTLSVAVREEDGLQNEACPICLENFQVGEKVRRLPCMHLFHVVGGEASVQGRHCNIDRHLVLDKQCPICKTPIDVMEKMEREGAQTAAPAAQPSDGNGSAELSRSARDPPVNSAVESTVAATPVADVTAQQPETPAQSPAGEEETRGQPGQQVQQGQQSAGLPEQAAELERIVRSLQSRWLQIQDVVAGVQQMLHYIEGSQSATPPPRDSAGSEGAANAGPREVSEEPAAATAPAEANEQPPPSPDTSQAVAPTGTAATRTLEVRSGPAAPRPGESSPEAPNWQPFTTAEKVCNAYIWRRRRLGMLREMATNSGTS